MANDKNIQLVEALRLRESAYSDAFDRARSGDDMDGDSVRALREAIELTRCLRRLVPDCNVGAIHRAFGAPGDFGYDTPIGDALIRIYRGEPPAQLGLGTDDANTNGDSARES